MLVGGRCRRKTKYAIRIGCRLDGPVDHDALIDQFGIDRLRVGHPRNLSRSFRSLYEEEWRDDWAAFRDSGPPQVEIVLTQRATKGDAHHRRAWELIASDPELLAEYRSLKEMPEDYAERKAAFFERVVARLPD
jgi:hypothetical protein